MANKTIAFDLRPLQIGHENRGIGMVVKSVLEHLPDDEIKYLFYVFEKDNPIERLGIKVSTSNYELVESPTLKHEIKKPRDMIDGLRLTFHKFRPLKKHSPDTFVQFDIALGVPKWHQIKTYAVGYDLIPMIMRDEYLPSPLHALRVNRRINPFALILGVVALPFHPRKVNSIFRKAVSRLKISLRSSYHLTRYRYATKTYKKVNGILCISKATKQSFKELLKIREDRLFDLALAPVLSQSNPNNHIANKVKKPYVFYIGGTDDRKRVQDIVHAFNIVRGRGTDLRLVLAGNEFMDVEQIPNLTLRKAILSSPYSSDIHLVGFVDDDEKLGLYQNALAFIFSSAYEGFGLPILEAAEMECPVVAYNNSSISELASNDSAILVETGDFISISKAIQKLVSDKNLSKKLTKRAKSTSHRYSWQRTTSNLLAIITR